ncbi:MAG: small basic family protein [Armatimonadetes bacterium]|nr:small basic family protein [Armatimonadota bacterium]
MWLPVVGFLIGFYLIWFNNVTIPNEYASYLSLATIAGIDTILGGIRSGLEGRFKSDIFISGFFVNTVMAALLAYFGDQIGVPDLYLAAVVVLGWRIFLNLSLIRRYMLGRAQTRQSPVADPTRTSLAAPDDGLRTPLNSPVDTVQSVESRPLDQGVVPIDGGEDRMKQADLTGAESTPESEPDSAEEKSAVGSPEDTDQNVVEYIGKVG